MWRKWLCLEEVTAPSLRQRITNQGLEGSKNTMVPRRRGAGLLSLLRREELQAWTFGILGRRAPGCQQLCGFCRRRGIETGFLCVREKDWGPEGGDWGLDP